MISDINQLRIQFPILGREIYSKPLVYFDNAATAQKPLSVIEMSRLLLEQTNGNVHRAPHRMANDCTSYYEGAREKVRSFLNASGTDEIIFTSGTTASINLIARSFSSKFLKSGDTILLSQAEHHSNIVPWQLVANELGLNIKVLPVDQSGRILSENIDEYLDDSVKLISITHISNVTGLITPVKDICKKAKAKGVITVIDGAQGIVHSKVDVKDIGCDFYAFSAHKLYGPTGVGVLYGRRELLEQMPPWMGGGDMIESVSFEKTEYAPLPLKFEAGTPNYAGVAAMGAALDFCNSLGENIHKHESDLIKAMKEGLSEIDGIRLFGGFENERIPLFSFTVDGAHASDIAILMDKMGIALRSGKLCAEPLVKHFGAESVVRASLLPYNTLEEVEIFISSLKRVVKMLLN